MGFNYNKGVYGGRLVNDPELKQTESGTPVANFTVAVDRPYKKGAQKVTDFINCIAWKGTAEFVTRYFRKGNAICVTGSLQIRTWNDKNGDRRYAPEVIADEVCFVDNKQEAQAAAEEDDFKQSAADLQTQTGMPGSVIPDDIDDSLPF